MHSLVPYDSHSHTGYFLTQNWLLFSVEIEIVLFEVWTELLFISYMFHELFTLMQLKTSLCVVLSTNGWRGAVNHIYTCALPYCVLCDIYFGFSFNTSSGTIKIIADRAFNTITFELTEITTYFVLLKPKPEYK